MKYLTIVLFIASIASVCLMKKKEFKFEKATSINFAILSFEYPRDTSDLNDSITAFKVRGNAPFLIEQLSFDYIFMACIYPFIFCLCMLSVENLKAIMPAKRQRLLAKILTILAMLQLLAWLMDYCENARLEKWIGLGRVDNFMLFKLMVVLKFIIGGAGFILGLSVFIYTSLKRYKDKKVDYLTSLY